jgi:predicted SnoaL-like aldol condensation-catalyzing enzyme
MPTPEESNETVSTFAHEVFGNKNLDYAAAWLADDFVEHQVFPGTTPDKQGAIDSYRIFFAASPDMTAEIHDMVAAGDRVAIRATYRGTDKGGFIPGMPATGKPMRWRPCISSGSTSRARSPSTGVWSTPSARWVSLGCCHPQAARRRLTNGIGRLGVGSVRGRCGRRRR